MEEREGMNEGTVQQRRMAEKVKINVTQEKRREEEHKKKKKKK